MAGKLNRLVVSVIMVSALLMTLTPTMAEDVITGTRTISSTTAVPGETVTITVEISMLSAVYGPIIDENIPNGWGINVADNGGSTYKSIGTSWLFSGVLDGTKKVVYDVEIPIDAANGKYYITGTTQAVVGHEITGPYQILGDSVINVVSADNSPDVAVDVGNPTVSISSIDVNDPEDNSQVNSTQTADVVDSDQPSKPQTTESHSTVPFINPLPIIAITVYCLRRRGKQ